jgi:hypothetical protein
MAKLEASTAWASNYGLQDSELFLSRVEIVILCTEKRVELS